MRELRKKTEGNVEKIAINATRWIGSTSSLIVHTILFIASFSLYFLGIAFDKILLVLTTILSLEAIYLSIFIQMSVNRQASQLEEVAQDVEEIQEDVEGIEKDVEEIQEDVEGIEKDVDNIQENVEEINEEEDESLHSHDDAKFARIEETLATLMKEITDLKKK